MDPSHGERTIPRKERIASLIYIEYIEIIIESIHLQGFPMLLMYLVWALAARTVVAVGASGRREQGAWLRIMEWRGSFTCNIL